MWLGTMVLMTAANAQEIKDKKVDPDDVAYAKAVEALVVQGTLVEPALPVGLATVLLEEDSDFAGTSVIVVTILQDPLDGAPSRSSVELDSDADFDGDVDGRDFLVWQRGGSPNPLSTSDSASWQSNYGTTYATIDAEAWLGAALPELDDRVLLGPPDDVELMGFEVEQDGKVRGALLWEIRTTPKGNTEVVSHLWATAAFEPLVNPTETLDLVHVGLQESIPAFYEGVVLKLDSDPIATYEQGSEFVLKIIKR